MDVAETIFVLGAGAIGFPLAAYLTAAGRSVVAVRTSRHDLPRGTTVVTVHAGAEELQAEVDTVSLAHLPALAGLVVVAAKSYANAALARELARKAPGSPLVLLQNGLEVEQPFLDGPFPSVYRGVLYATSQGRAEAGFSFRPVAASPVGVVRGSEAELARCVALLSTEQFPFRAEPHIQREVWKKALINVVFNSICPLLDADNGVFVRDEAVAALAASLVAECVALTDRLGLDLTEAEILAQVRLISARSTGQRISTLQDLEAGRPTEIGSLNLAMARIAAALEPSLPLPRTELLGRLIEARASQGRGPH